MSRAWRIEFSGAYYHVLSRGNEQGAIFTDDEDRQLFLDLLGEMADRFDVAIYAYVLMPNHYHILLKTQKANLSESMQWFGLSYARRYNNRHGRSGHLFQGRFKSFLIENDAYLRRLSYYIHRNPLRAGIVDRLASYKWSSYLPYAYGKKQAKWLTTELILSQYKGNKRQKHKLYRQKVQQYAQEEVWIWEDLKHGLFFGTQEFIDEMRGKHLPTELQKEKPQQKGVKKSIDRMKLIEMAAKLLDADLEIIQHSKRLSGDNKVKRDLLINLLWKIGIYTNEEIGGMFGLTYSSVSKSVDSIRKRIQKDKKIKKVADRLYSQFKM